MKHPYTAFSVVLGVLVLSSCARSPRPTPAPVSPSGDCRLDRPSSDRPSVPAEARADGRSDRVRAVDVALLDPFDPAHAPVPRTSSERLVFGHFYETLVRVDCGGAVRSGLAVAWREEEDGRRWLFTLREDATFWDGSPVTPRDVVASWAAAARTSGADDGALPAWIEPAPRPRRFTVKGDGSFEVVFSPPHPASPAAFAHPAAAIRGTGSEDAWPPGSGPYRPVLAGERAGGDAAAERGRAGGGDVLARRAGGASEGPFLRFRPAAGRDARDLLEGDVDLLASRDPEVLSYAEAHPAFVTVPLPWDRLYVFVPPPTPAAPPVGTAGARPAGRGAHPGPDSGVAALRRSLARDVARSEARPARQPAGGERGLPGSGRVLYPRGDADARALAERLVALATSPEIPGRAVPAVVAELGSEPRPPRAVGVSPRRLAAALERRRTSTRARSGPPADAMVVAIPSWRLPESWRATEPPGELSGALPLIETRARLILRGGISGVAVDGSGTPILSGVRP